MTNPQEQFVELTKRSQDAVTAAMRSWADGIQAISGGRGPIANPSVIVDQVFDFAEHLLANQREFAKSLLAASTEAADTVSSHARKATESVTDNAVQTAQAVTEKAEAVGKSGSAQAASTPRATRNTSKSAAAKTN